MLTGEPVKFYSMDEVMDRHLGPIGTPKRDAFEEKLRLDLLGKVITATQPDTAAVWETSRRAENSDF